MACLSERSRKFVCNIRSIHIVLHNVKRRSVLSINYEKCWRELKERATSIVVSGDDGQEYCPVLLVMHTIETKFTEEQEPQ